MNLLLVTLALLGSADDPAASPEFRAFVAEYDAAFKAWDDRYSPGGKATPEDQWIARHRDWPGWAFLPRAAAIGGGRAGDPATVAAFLWVGEQVQGVGLDDAAIYPALETVLGRILPADLDRLGDDPRLVNAFRYVFRRPSPATEAFLNRILAESGDRSTRGRACLALGRLHASRAATHRDPWYERPGRTPFDSYIVSRRDRRLDDYIRSCDPLPTQAAAAAALRRASDEFDDVTYAPPVNGTSLRVGAMARSDLNELEHLQVGMIAPTLEGIDVDGKPLKLADFRGKVVALSFWGTWCGPCMALVPHERALVERMQGRPFVILGVNSDDSPDKARAVMARERMTWPSFFDGGRVGGPIAEQWNVGSWPTIYVLDATGTIRFKGSGPTDLDAAVDAAFQPLKPTR